MEGNEQMSMGEQLAAVEALLMGQDPKGQEKEKEGDQEGSGNGSDSPSGKADAQQAEGDQGEGDDAPEGAKDPSDAEKNLKDDSGLDYGLIVPLGGGRETTLGELKDYFTGAESREVEVQEREAGILRRQVEMDEIVHVLFRSGQLPPSLKMTVANYLDEHHARASAAVLENIPAWKDESSKAADYGLIRDLAREYGLGAQIEHQLQYPSHPGTLQLLRDFARLKETVRKARGDLRPKPDAQSRIKPQKAPAVSQADSLAARARQTGRTSDKVSAVAALLKG